MSTACVKQLGRYYGKSERNGWSKRDTSREAYFRTECEIKAATAAHKEFEREERERANLCALLAEESVHFFIHI